MNPTTNVTMIAKQRRLTQLLAAALALTSAAHAETPAPDPAKDKAAFENASAVKWKEVFADDCTGDWRRKWHLDGEVGTVATSPGGMTLTAGPEYKNDAHHVVLWTKENFTGDVKIEYDVTRLDESAQGGIILLYIQATGSGQAPYAKDIFEWSELRKVPAMATYFNHMNLYHISFATNPGKPGYFRGRRYMPHRSGLKGTELKPEYTADRLLAKGVSHHITVIKTDRELFMRIRNPDETRHYHIINSELPVITAGRIGLRHMFGRSSRYADFRVSVPDSKTE
jgi:hypothetical protein